MSEFDLEEITDRAGTGAPNFTHGFNINGSDSGLLAPTHTEGATEPSSPSNGDTWWDTDNDVYKVYMNNQWKDWLGTTPVNITSSQVTDTGTLGLGTGVQNATGFTESISLTTNNYVSGKRYVIALFGYRYASTGGNYPSNVQTKLISSASLGGTSLTVISEGVSLYNNSCIAAGFVDLTGSQNFVTTFTKTTGSGGDGYLAFMVFDGVSGATYGGGDAGAEGSTSSLTISNSYTQPTSNGYSVRLVGLNSSNGNPAPTFSSSDGFTYTSWFSQDNGTDENSVGYYHIASSATTTENRIAGSMSGGTASGGMAWAVADFKLT